MACKKRTARLSLFIKMDFYNLKFYLLSLKQSRFDFNLVLVHYYFFSVSGPKSHFQKHSNSSLMWREILLSGCIYWNGWSSFIEFSPIITNYSHHPQNSLGKATCKDKADDPRWSLQDLQAQCLWILYIIAITEWNYFYIHSLIVYRTAFLIFCCIGH